MTKRMSVIIAHEVDYFRDALVGMLTETRPQLELQEILPEVLNDMLEDSPDDSVYVVISTFATTRMQEQACG
jgi:hypothetical protein